MKTLWAAGLIALIASAPTAALAAPVLITYPFEVTATSGPLSGVTAAGTFTYDTAITPPGGGQVLAVGLLSELNFTWDSITYNASTANTGGLELGSSGNFLAGLFGTTCEAGNCSVTAFTDQWFFSAENPNNAGAPPGGVDFTYATPLSLGYGGTGAIGKPTCTNLSGAPVPCPVPEPPSMALLFLGFAWLAVLGRRRRPLVIFQPAS